jgi:lipid II:glycine glycyltransferase (peptidoglycan interpeptide bridge formation enzyme)
MSPRVAPVLGAAVRQDGAWQLRISHEAEHPEWDAFLERTPGGHHAQASLWAQAKGCQGWKSARVLVTQTGRIVGGAQMLMRALPLVGAIGYLPKGPICAVDEDLSLSRLVLRELHGLARACRVRCLILQPPNNGEALARRLPDWGFSPSAIRLPQPTATALLDLDRDPETLLAAVHPQTRYNIRLGLRRGVVVRQGTAADVPLYCRLMAATGQRQGFAPEPEAYVAELYRLLAARGWCALFIAEYQGEPVSAALAICFGDTVYYKRGAWSGAQGRHRPNEVLQWEMILWARSKGYRQYDFEGIDAGVARALLRGESPDLTGQTVSSFKLGFGGRVVLFPEIFARVYDPVLRWGWNRVLPKVLVLPLAMRMLTKRFTGAGRPLGQ